MQESFKRILVTGSNGLLGQKMIKLLLNQDGVEVFAVSRGKNRINEKDGYIYYGVDLAQKDMVIELIHKIKPHYIVHTAAMTNVDACELNQEMCDVQNIEVVETLVETCKKLNIHLVHLSTDFVFSGKKGLYTELDPPDPVNHYGLSKLKSEEIVIQSGIRYSILRTVLVYGVVDGNDRNNVVLWVKSSLEKGESIRVVTDQHRMPTYAEDLAEACWNAIRFDATGIFNVSSCELMSIYEIALAIAEEFGLDASLIQQVETSALNLPAERPTITEFDLSKSVEQLELPLFDFKNRLQVFHKQLINLGHA